MALPIVAMPITAGALASVVIGVAAPAGAATPAPLSGTADALIQSASTAGTWTTTAYLNTAALCAEPVTFALQLTPSPGRPVPAATTSGVTANCGAAEAAPITPVTLSFSLAEVPQSATLVVTPSPVAAPSETSCFTMFGIGADLAIAGWVPGYDLAAAPLWGRSLIAAFSGAAALVIVWYGVFAIRSLADTRDGSVLSGRRDASFIL